MIQKLIAHQIVKEPHRRVSSLVKRDEALPVSSELSEALFSELQRSFRSHNPAVGRFREADGAESPFRQGLNQYQDSSNRLEDDFVETTSRSMDLLQAEMNKQSLATGGYVVFAEYEANGHTFLHVSLLSTKAQPTFDEELNLVAAITPNLTNLRHAARINLNGVRDNTDGVVQFISRRGVADYFVEFLGCEEVAKPDAQGRILHSVLGAWANEQEFDDEQRSDLMSRAYDYWQDCRKSRKPMTLTTLSNWLAPESPETLRARLTAEGQHLAGEFPPPPPSVMKRFVRFAYHGGGIRIEFDRNQWSNRIDVSEADRTMTIRDIPDELLTQFKAENE